MVDAQTKLAEIVRRHPACARILQKHRIDFCCRGNVPIDVACRDRDLDTSAVLAEIEAALHFDRDHTIANPAELSTAALIEHIVQTHHAYLRTALPSILGLAAKVRCAHGDRNPRLIELELAVRDLNETLIPHLDTEEDDLFPFLARGLSGAKLVAELAEMRDDHLLIAGALARIRAAAEGFNVPAWACGSYRALLSELEHLEADTFKHVHLENHVLLPRFGASVESPEHR
jgi:regulator of cell morphogenesis and NO signaling